MRSVSIREFCETIYCAYAPFDALTPGPDAIISFAAHVTTAGRTVEHRVEFRDVAELTRSGDRREYEESDRLELSVIEVEREPSRWRVWLNPWYLDEIEFRCREIVLDGHVVVGPGRWLQDWLPEQRSV